MKKTLFIKNAAILTVSSLILRFAGIIFRVWLAAKIGSEGIGLYQLVFSVYMFAATFATSGVCTATTRLVSRELVLGNKLQVQQIIKTCVAVSCVIAFASMAFLHFGADFIAIRLLRDARATLSVKILAFSLPFMGICSCLKGYFIARRKASPTSSAQILEQAVRIAVIVPLVTKFNHFGLKYTCAAVLLGDTLAEAISCLFVYVRYRIDIKRLRSSNSPTHPDLPLLPQISHIALPITLGRYLNTLLRTTENVLVPICLSASALGGNGISMFGMIKGMALPVLFFPSTLLGALSTLLLPEIAEASIRNKQGVLRGIVSRIVKITLLVSIIFSAIFMTCGRQIGLLIYGNADVGFLLAALSPIIPFMYLDALCDGILKGLDQQKFTFFTSVGDSTIRILLVLLLLNKFGIYGFIGVMYFSNFLTGVLNTARLLRVSRVKLDFLKTIVMPVLCGFSLCFFARSVIRYVGNNLIYVLSVSAVCITLYLVILFLLRIIDHDDISFIKRK